MPSIKETLGENILYTFQQKSHVCLERSRRTGAIDRTDS
jgi:hypothetical protein